jgi:hypothetical protein
MLEFYEPGAAIIEDTVAQTMEQVNEANRRVLDFMLGAQKVVLEEAIFVTDEILGRVRTETHLFSEFISKVAGVHSVKDLSTLREECGQHQIEFIRGDSVRIAKHGERMIDATASLFNSRLQI